MISKNFSVEDIHEIRRINYERTKHMTKEELIQDSKKRATAIKERLLLLQEKTIIKT